MKKGRDTVPAFTLLETIVVLGIISLISTLGYSGHQQIARNKELEFWQRFDLEWRRAQSFVEGTDNVVVFTFHQGGILIDLTIKATGKRQRIALTQPATLHIRNGGDVTISNNSVSSMHNYSFESDIDKQVYTVSWGLGIGVFTIDPKPKGLYSNPINDAFDN